MLAAMLIRPRIFDPLEIVYIWSNCTTIKREIIGAMGVTQKAMREEQRGRYAPTFTV